MEPGHRRTVRISIGSCMKSFMVTQPTPQTYSPSVQYLVNGNEWLRSPFYKALFLEGYVWWGGGWPAIDQPEMDGNTMNIFGKFECSEPGQRCKSAKFQINMGRHRVRYTMLDIKNIYLYICNYRTLMFCRTVISVLAAQKYIMKPLISQIMQSCI